MVWTEATEGKRGREGKEGRDKSVKRFDSLLEVLPATNTTPGSISEIRI